MKKLRPIIGCVCIDSYPALQYGAGVSMTTNVAMCLFHDLVDDAAMFPPGNASAADALERHHVWRAGTDAEIVGPLLVHSSRWEELVAAHADAGGRTDVVVIGATDPPEPPASALDVVALETVSPDGELPSTAGRVAVEPGSLDVVESLLANLGEARIDGRPLITKFRTGGLTADAFPSEGELAYCVLAAFNAGVPFKLTAGLHHAVRHTALDTGFEHHGFLNVLVAVGSCLHGAGEAELVDVLAERDSSNLVAEIVGLSEDEAIAIRTVFTSFGCCGVDEPIADLRSLGLLGGAT
jgi:hypothetical protein